MHTCLIGCTMRGHEKDSLLTRFQNCQCCHPPGCPSWKEMGPDGCQASRVWRQSCNTLSSDFFRDCFADPCRVTPIQAPVGFVEIPSIVVHSFHAKLRL